MTVACVKRGSCAKKIVVSTILDKAPEGTSPMLGQVLVVSGERQPARWLPGERLDQLFEEQCDRLRESGQGSHLAMDSDELTLTYDQLDDRANQLARYLIARGCRPGDKIALMFDESVRSFVGMFAVLESTPNMFLWMPDTRGSAFLHHCRCRRLDGAHAVTFE